VSNPGRITGRFEVPPVSASSSRKTIKFDVDYEDEPSPIGIVESQPWNLASLPVDFQDMLNDTYAELVYQPESSVTYRLGVRSHVGKNKQKRINGDRLFAQQWAPTYRDPAETSSLVIVVDGEKFGQAVSKQVVEELSDAMVPLLLSDMDEETLVSRLFSNMQSLLRAVQVHYDLGEEVPGIFVALLIHTTAYVLELGTCRGYLYRGSHELGRIQDFEPEHLHGDAQLHLWALALEDNDILIGCSDGLWRYLPEPEISSTLALYRQEPAEAAFELIDKGLERSGEDYLTVVLVSVTETHS
jgi:serine/threonine protein phosphatase PrpC